MKRALLIMAKRPAKGQTKTRLCPPLSFQEAAELYECFLKDTVEMVRSVRLIMPEVQPCIAYSPPDARGYFAELAPDFELVCQAGETLGERLDHVLTTSLQNGYEQAAAISSDSPTLPPMLITQSFRQLQQPETDLVLGPSEDGGYYLIGMDRPRPRLVREVEMSTSTVLADTLKLAQEDGIRVHLLPSWYDVDTIEELNRLQREISQLSLESIRHSRQFIEQMSGRVLLNL